MIKTNLINKYYFENFTEDLPKKDNLRKSINDTITVKRFLNCLNNYS